MPGSKNSAPPLINGFLNLYKPIGITSMEALRQVKRSTGQRNKVGHGGTMDPLASGVLPVCFGQATRLMDHVLGGRKQYRMEIKLGVSTTTYDAEGDVVLERDPAGVTLNAVVNAVQGYIGEIQQIPPMYSAIKFQGQRLYKLARAGIEVERQARPVQIHLIRVVDCSPPSLTLEVECGRGAYMRSLADDLGETLGCGGHISDLVRLASGSFHADEAITPDQLEEAATGSGGWEDYLHPVDWVLRDLKTISVGPKAEQYLRNGQSISFSGPTLEAAYLEEFRAYSHEGRFLALVRCDRPTSSWRPLKVFRLDAVSPYAPINST